MLRQRLKMQLFFAAGVEKFVEGPELWRCEAGKEGFAELRDARGDLLEQPFALRREADAEDAFVVRAGGAADEAGGFGALEQARDVGGLSDETRGDITLRDAVGTGASDDAEDVVLGPGEGELTEVLLHAVHEDGRGSGEVEQDLLLEGIERPGLADLFLEGRRHRVHCIAKIRVRNREGDATPVRLSEISGIMGCRN